MNHLGHRSKQSYIVNIARNSDANSFKTQGRNSSGPMNLSSYLRDYLRRRRSRPTGLGGDILFCRLLNTGSYQAKVTLNRQLHKCCQCIVFNNPLKI